MIYDRKCLWLWVPGHLAQHSPGGVYELEQLSGGQGLLSHSTLPCWGEEEAASAGLKGEQYSVLCGWRGHAYLTGADVAGLVRGGKPLAIVIDTMVIGAAFTHCTTGAWGEERDSVLQLHRHLYLKKKEAQTRTFLPVILVGWRHSVEGQRVCVHKASPFAQVQLEQGPSGCQLKPSSYSTPSNTHAIRWDERSYAHWWAAPVCVCVCVCVCLRVSACECIVNLCISDSRHVGL